MQKYHNFWRPVNVADMLEIAQVLAAQKRLCYIAEKHNLQKGSQILFNFGKF